MNIILFDPPYRPDLLPLAFTRPVAGFRVGILTIEEKWQKYFQAKTYHLTQYYLKEKFPLITKENNLLINGSVCPDVSLVGEIKKLKKEEALYSNEVLIALHAFANELNDIETLVRVKIQTQSKNPVIIKSQPDIFSRNGEELKKDFDILTKAERKKRREERRGDRYRSSGLQYMYAYELLDVGYNIFNYLICYIGDWL